MNIATDVEFKENIDHYLKVMEDGGEIIVTKDGKISASLYLRRLLRSVSKTSKQNLKSRVKVLKN